MDSMEEVVVVPGDISVCETKTQRRKRQKLLITELFLDFAQNTTLHGLRYITQVGLSLAEKIFWIITFLISLGMCLWLIEKVWYKWQYSPVIVSLNERMIPVGEIPFPSVTVCPQWKCKRSVYKYEQEIRKFFFDNDNQSEHNPLVNEKQMLEDAIIVCDRDKGKFLLDRNVSDVSLIRNIRKMSPQIQDIFFSCNWRDQWISCDKIFEEVLTSEGVCYNFNSLSYEDMFRNESLQKEYRYLNTTEKTANWDFNSGYSSQTKAVYPRRGQENGALPDFTFELKEQPENNDERCNGFRNGFKIYVQHPADMPQSALYYYAAVPGQLTSLAVKFSILNTSESLINYRTDQRQCYFTSDRQLDYFKIYTPSNCHLECSSKYTYKRCGCVWFHMPHSNSSELCTAKSHRCVTDAKNELASKTMKYDMGEACNCLPSCANVQYDAEILKTTFDFKKNSESDKKMISRNKSKDSKMRALYPLLMSFYSFSAKYNFSKVEMYFKDPRSVAMRRSELFGLTDFLANCGGLLGLFLGFSFLSLVEIFYFCTLRLWHTLKKDTKMEKKEFTENISKH